jgi:VPS62-like protein
VRGVLGLAILALAWALAIAGAAAGGRAPTPSLTVLLARHVPVLVLHPDEQFQPVPVEGFLADSDLTQKIASGWVPVSGPLPAGGADLRLDQRLCHASDGLVTTPCYVAAEAAHAASPVVYGAAFRTKTRIDLQYWLWYPYDDFSPGYPATDFWQVHEGDWEAVSVILDRSGKPLSAAYSQHAKGQRRAWSKTPKQGQRPVVYVGLGSHANFFTAGEQPLAPPATDQAAINVMKAYGIAVPADHTGRGRVIRPKLVRITARTPSWMTFAGAWGETEYLHIPDRDLLAGGAGPRGPAFHAQWRRPVAEEMTWPRG